MNSYSESSHQDRDCVLVWSSCAAHDCGSWCVVANGLLLRVIRVWDGDRTPVDNVYGR
jgi:hypothetical protein